MSPTLVRLPKEDHLSGKMWAEMADFVMEVQDQCSCRWPSSWPWLYQTGYAFCAPSFWLIFNFRCIFTLQWQHCHLGIDLSDGVWSHQLLSRDQTRQVGGWASPAECWGTKRWRSTWSTRLKREGISSHSAWFLQTVWKRFVHFFRYLMVYLNKNIFILFLQDFEFFQGYFWRSHVISFGK